MEKRQRLYHGALGRSDRYSRRWSHTGDTVIKRPESSSKMGRTMTQQCKACVLDSIYVKSILILSLFLFTLLLYPALRLLVIRQLGLDSIFLHTLM